MAKMSWTLSHSGILALQKRRLSSTKKQMIQPHTVQTIGSPVILLSLFSFVEERTKTLHTQTEKIRREWVTLTDSSGGYDISKWVAINENRVRYHLNTSHKHMDPSSIKPQFLHNCLQETPLNSVKSLAHIQLQCHIALSTFHSFVHSVHGLKRHHDIIRDETPRDKCTLVRGDNVR
jgi:hypothetical protein